VKELYAALKSTEDVAIKIQTKWVELFVEFALDSTTDLSLDPGFFLKMSKDLVVLVEALGQSEDPDFSAVLEILEPLLVSFVHKLVQSLSKEAAEAICGDISILHIVFQQATENHVEEAIELILEMTLLSEKTVDWLCNTEEEGEEK
jgi:hypothetical protein